MKNLANCTPREFALQTIKIRRLVGSWIKDVGFEEIRKHAPKIPEGASKEEAESIVNEQVKTNAFAMFDSMLEEHLDETLAVLAVANFIEPEDIDNHKMSEFYGSLAEMLDDENVLSFFTSLARLTPKIISGIAKI